MQTSVLPGHTPGHVNCQLCETSRRKHIPSGAFAELTFEAAAPLWLAKHRDEIAEKTIHDYEYYLRSLTKFFGDLKLSAIHLGHIEQYQEWRQTARTDENGREWTAGPSAINHEVNTLAQILGVPGLWKELAKFYRPLKQPKSRVGKALADVDQERKLFAVAASNPRWKLAYWASLLTANTGAGPNEIRHLRLCDLNLESKPPYISIREGLKNEFRERTLPLNDSALWAVKQILKRAQRIGAAEPEDHLMPHRARSGGAGWDFGTPIGSWKKAWHALRAQAGMPTLRMYDLRHHALTKLFECPEVSGEVATDIMGHEDIKMSRHYSHIRLKIKEKALAAIEVKPGPSQLEIPFAALEAAAKAEAERAEAEAVLAASRRPPGRVLAFRPLMVGSAGRRH
jgi:integrase